MLVGSPVHRSPAGATFVWHLKPLSDGPALPPRLPGAEALGASQSHQVAHTRHSEAELVGIEICGTHFYLQSKTPHTLHVWTICLH